MKIQRGVDVSQEFMASSPPIGHDLLTQVGLELSEHDRVLFWETELVLMDSGGQWGLPKRGDILIDQSDNSEWKVIPQGNGSEAWKYHGQDKTAVMVVVKRDNV